MTKTLELSFKSSLDKPVKLQLPQLNNVVTEQVARDSMNALVDLNIIKSNSGTLSPKYILLKLLIKQQLFYLKIRNRYKESAINLV